MVTSSGDSVAAVVSANAISAGVVGMAVGGGVILKSSSATMKLLPSASINIGSIMPVPFGAVGVSTCTTMYASASSLCRVSSARWFSLAVSVAKRSRRVCHMAASRPESTRASDTMRWKLLYVIWVAGGVVVLYGDGWRFICTIVLND